MTDARLCEGISWFDSSGRMVHVSLQEKELFNSAGNAKDKMLKYKDTFVAKGSALFEAMQLKDAKLRKKESEKIYKQTTVNAKKLFGDDYEWFMAFNK